MNQQDSGNDTLSLTIEDKAVLHSAYMSCLRHGGLFPVHQQALQNGR